MHSNPDLDKMGRGKNSMGKEPRQGEKAQANNSKKLSVFDLPIHRVCRRVFS